MQSMVCFKLVDNLGFLKLLSKYIHGMYGKCIHLVIVVFSGKYIHLIMYVFPS